ncbi:cupin domain-containing protein [Falsiruegeria mediterranea]|uniref:Cupin type-2 domain-containing protein n=1 Tax=Falsiruegeria mediterranea M17 TaxID=1200281 RepID=A0A2R8CDK7_9RHOB|nr:cupin domain-containing protein [Falsiruegeria mediterranea]SPJ30530.1 hypothetical protein TRM7615_04064 [Falsiruegeria mediterranea M17]
MPHLSHDAQSLETWRPGVETRMRVSALTGSHTLCIFEQYCDPGLGAPLHQHAVEEVLEVISGTAEIWLNDEIIQASANMSVLIPAGNMHGFRNTGQDTLHVRATLASPVFEASYADDREQSRRWSPAG